MRAAATTAAGSTGADILPAIYSDNSIQLAPGESRTISITYAVKDAKKIVHRQQGAATGFRDTNVKLEVTGWNLEQ
mgnify:CR=1 FL=1